MLVIWCAINCALTSFARVVICSVVMPSQPHQRVFFVYSVNHAMADAMVRFIRMKVRHDVKPAIISFSTSSAFFLVCTCSS